MTDKAKADYRARTLELIERLDNQVQGLPVKAELSSTDGDEKPGFVEAGTIYMTWTFSWQLMPGSVETQSFMATLDELYNVINSKEGVRMFPRGLYRDLIEFSDKCEDRKKWAERSWSNLSVPETQIPTDEEVLKEAEDALRKRVDEFRKDIKFIKRAIFFFENERDESEESFMR